MMFSALSGTLKNRSCFGLSVLGCHLRLIAVAMVSRERSLAGICNCTTGRGGVWYVGSNQGRMS